MKLILVLGLLGLGALVDHAHGQASGPSRRPPPRSADEDSSSPRCTNPIIRKELRQLTTEERERFIEATRELHRSADFDAFPAMHRRYAEVVHGNAVFLPWHRRYIKDYERALQRIDPQVTLPYWDWTLDSQRPAASPVLSPQFCGGDGDDSGCVGTGPFSHMAMYVPAPHCLNRQFNEGDEGISPWWPVESIRLMSADAESYSAIRDGIEFGQHGMVHLGIQGDMSTMHASNDPIFFLHHAMVDKVWAVWQDQNPDLAFDYNGLNANLMPASLNDPLPGYQESVESAMDMMADDYCYEYSTSFYDSNMAEENENLQASLSQPSSTSTNGDDASSSTESAELMRRQDFTNPDLSLSTSLATSQLRLKPPKAIPEWWIKMNKLNETKLRSFETKQFNLLMTINALEQYVPLVLRAVDSLLDSIEEDEGDFISAPTEQDVDSTPSGGDAVVEELNVFDNLMG
ncbi:hypothetical protein H4R35_006508 [Dimargaris xerosporica]|nr:hypothetical protein H4R35_006508 [Dimargaris xerosporica]